MNPNDTHERWHPHEDEVYLRAAIARVNGGDMDDRIRRRKLEGVLAQFFDATRGTSSYEMYRAHLEQTANEVTDLFAALGDAPEPLEDAEINKTQVDTLNRIEVIVTDYHTMKAEGTKGAAQFIYGAARALGTTVAHLLDPAWRDAYAAALGGMNEHDAIERVAQAIAEEHGVLWGPGMPDVTVTESIPGKDTYRRMASAALAALTDVAPEPLEDALLADGAITIVSHILPPQNGHGTRVAVSVQHRDGRRKDTHGTGPTIDAAVRAAVANAKDGER